MVRRIWFILAVSLLSTACQNTGSAVAAGERRADQEPSICIIVTEAGLIEVNGTAVELDDLTGHLDGFLTLAQPPDVIIQISPDARAGQANLIMQAVMASRIVPDALTVSLAN